MYVRCPPNTVRRFLQSAEKSSDAMNHKNLIEVESFLSPGILFTALFTVLAQPSQCIITLSTTTFTSTYNRIKTHRHRHMRLEKKRKNKHNTKDKRSKTQERFCLTNCFFCVVYQAEQFQCIHPTSDFLGKTLRNIHPTSKFLQESLENLQN